MTLSQVDITPIQGLVQELWDRGGTDIHLTVGAPPQIRIDGELYPVEGQAVLHESDTDLIARTMLPSELWDELIARKEIDCRFRHELIAVRPDTREAVFRNLDSGELAAWHYDLLHVTPPMGPPDFLARSPLADQEGWVDVDSETLQHKRYPGVFALGDCSNLPTSKTGAAIRKQAPVLVRNLVDAIAGKPLPAKYDGYTSCPVVTGIGKLVLAEFNYRKEPNESFPIDQSKERWSMWILKRYLLPQMYWHGMLKGRM